MALKISVDWDNDRDFSDVNEDITADVESVRWFLGARNAYQAVCDEPTCEIVVRNTDGKYTPENSSSPIYNKIRPYRRIRIEETVGGGYQLWNGYLDIPNIDWSPMGDYTGCGFVVLRGVGAKQALERIEVKLALYSDVTIDTVITDALRKAGVFLPSARGWFLGVTGFSELGVSTFLLGPDSWFDAEVGVSVIPTYGDEVKKVLEIIAELVETERGKFFIARDGKFVLWNRHHVYLATSNDSTINDDDVVEMEYEYGTDLVNSVLVSGNPRRVQTSETLWELDDSLTIPVGEVVEFEARLRRNTGQFAGAGAITATPTFTSGTATITTTPRGGLTIVKIDNATGAIPAILSGLVLSGSPSYNQNSIRVLREDKVSIAEFGRRETSINAGVTGDYGSAEAIADTELGRRTLRGLVKSVSMRNAWDSVTNAYMFADNQIGYAVRVNAPTMSHDDRYVIIGEEHSWQRGGEHNTTFYFEPLPDTVPPMTWDVAKWDESYWVF